MKQIIKLQNRAVRSPKASTDKKLKPITRPGHRCETRPPMSSYGARGHNPASWSISANNPRKGWERGRRVEEDSLTSPQNTALH